MFSTRFKHTVFSSKMTQGSFLFSDLAVATFVGRD